jgi:hypothetical protein
MGLGVDSFDSGWMLPVFQAPFSADELTENLPNSSSPLVAFWLRMFSFLLN